MQRDWDARSYWSAQSASLRAITAAVPDVLPNTLIVALDSSGAWPATFTFRHALLLLTAGARIGLVPGAHDFLYPARFVAGGVSCEPWPVIREPWGAAPTFHRGSEIVVLALDEDGTASLRGELAARAARGLGDGVRAAVPHRARRSRRARAPPSRRRCPLTVTASRHRRRRRGPGPRAPLPRMRRRPGGALRERWPARRAGASIRTRTASPGSPPAGPRLPASTPATSSCWRGSRTSSSGSSAGARSSSTGSAAACPTSRPARCTTWAAGPEASSRISPRRACRSPAPATPTSRAWPWRGAAWTSPWPSSTTTPRPRSLRARR